MFQMSFRKGLIYIIVFIIPALGFSLSGCHVGQAWTYLYVLELTLTMLDKKGKKTSGAKNLAVHFHLERFKGAAVKMFVV